MGINTDASAQKIQYDLVKVNYMALHIDTKVIMNSGVIRSISSLQVGDLLMGEDSTPRKILELNPVIDHTYEVRPIRGMPFITDDKQVLLLQKSIYLVNNKGEKVNNHYPKYRHFPNRIPVTVSNVLVKNSSSLFKCFFLHKAKLMFPHSPVPIDPYFLGLWLGDGTKHLTSITSMDDPIINEIYKEANKWGLKVSINAKENNKASTYTIVRGNVAGFGKTKNPLFTQFKILNLIKNKHIPSIYLYNSERIRLELLAGFIDTDGSLRHNVYDAFQKDKQVADDICQLANSLGFRSYIKVRTKKIKSINFEGQYYTVTICGDINRIPVRLNRKKVGFISARHDRRSTGFRIYPNQSIQSLLAIRTDGDNAFLLEDGTILSGENLSVPAFNSYFYNQQDLLWNQKLDEVISFIKENGRYPSYSKTANQNEKRLKTWLVNNTRRMLMIKYPKERIEKFKLLKSKLNGVIDYR